MELELNTTHLNCYDTVLDTTAACEETMESIVPDACPDILRIVDAEAMVCLKSKEAQEGRVEVAGSARVAVLYCPDGGGGLRRMTVTIPFTCGMDAPGVNNHCKVAAQARVQSVDARSLNPRKVLTRIRLCIEVRAFAPQTSALCDRVDCPPEGGLQQLGQTQQASMVTAVEEKPFTFSDSLSLSGNKPRMQELLKTRVDLICNESKIIGNKLIFKGQANLQLVYRDPSDSLCTAEFELPFSQIMEVSGVEEDAVCALSVELTGCECAMDEGGGGVDLSLAMLAQAAVREERQIALLADVYSTLYELTAERRPYTFHRMVEQMDRRVTVREIVETVTQAKNVCDVYVDLGEVHQSREGGVVTFTADTAVTVLYLEEEGGVAMVTRPIPVSCQAELPEGCVCVCHCTCSGERFASPAGSGVEVRYPIDFSWQALAPKSTSAVSDLHLDESTPRNTADQPSIVLRMVGEGERLWDLAKAYGTTMDDIVQANALTEETPPMGQLLLIPKKR